MVIRIVKKSIPKRRKKKEPINKRKTKFEVTLKKTTLLIESKVNKSLLVVLLSGCSMTRCSEKKSPKFSKSGPKLA